METDSLTHTHMPVKGDKSDGIGGLQIVRTICMRAGQARRHLHLSSDEAAQMLGVSASRLAAIEDGTAQLFGVDELIRLADVYCVSTDWLLGLTSDEDRAPGSELVDTAARHMAGLASRVIRQLADEGVRSILNAAPSEADQAQLVEAGLRVVETIQRFRLRNPGFDDAPVSSMLMLHADQLAELLQSEVLRTRRVRATARAETGAP